VLRRIVPEALSNRALLHGHHPDVQEEAILFRDGHSSKPIRPTSRDSSGQQYCGAGGTTRWGNAAASSGSRDRRSSGAFRCFSRLWVKPRMMHSSHRLVYDR
jgi:hypothetical protein